MATTTTCLTARKIPCSVFSYKYAKKKKQKVWQAACSSCLWYIFMVISIIIISVCVFESVQAFCYYRYRVSLYIHKYVYSYYMLIILECFAAALQSIFSTRITWRSLDMGDIQTHISNRIIYSTFS